MTRSPAAGAGPAERTLIRTRRGVFSAASRGMRGSEMVSRQAPCLPRETVSMVPVTVVGPSRRSSAGAATASVRIWASEKPAARAATPISSAPQVRRRPASEAAITAPDAASVQGAGSRGSEK